MGQHSYSSGCEKMVKSYQLYKIDELKPGDHLCCLYETDKEHKAVLTPYMRFGLENNEKVFYIVDTHTSDSVLDYLRDDGVQVESYLNSGQLVILTVNESYMKGGVFDPDSMINMLSEETEKALKEGYAALRVTGEMSWALKGLPGSERLIEYEAKVNEFFPNHKALAICQYDMGLFQPEILLNVLLTHPIVVIGTHIYENFYYMPPEKYPFDIPESTLKEWIKSLEVYNEANKFKENIINSLMDGFSLLDVDGVTLDVNHAFCKMTGFSREELIGKGPPQPYWPEEEYKNIRDAIENVLNGNVNEFEIILKRKNGERFPVIISPSTMRDEKGDIFYVFATFKDIKERKITEEDIKRRESILRAILESSKDSIFLIDDSGIILKVNEATAQRLGTKKEDMIGNHIKSFIPPDLYISRWKYFEKALKTNEIVEFEDERNGIFFYHTLSPVFEEGKVKKLAVFSKDITKRKLTENSLKEAHTKLEATLKAIPDLMFEIDREGRFYDYYAPASEDLYVPPDVFMGKKVSEVLPKEAANNILNAVTKASEIGWDKGTIYSLDLPQGKKWFELSIAKKAGDFIDEDLYVAIARDITKLKENEKDLINALNYNRSLLEVSLDPLVTIGVDGKITDVNDAVQLVTGYYRDQIIGTDFSDYFTSPERARAGYREVFRRGLVRDYPLEIQHKDGYVTPVIYNASVYYDENGEIAGVFAAARDITEIKRAHDEVIVSERRLNSIIDGSPIPQFVIDKGHKIIYWNDALKEISGIRAKEVIGKKEQWRAFYNEKRPCMADLLVDRSQAEIQKWYLGKAKKSKFIKDAYEAIDFFPAMGEDGKWLFFTAAPIRDFEGDVIGAVETLEDITERKKAEIALKKSEERFRAVAESAVDAIVTTDTKGNIIFFNDSLETIFGYHREELIKKPLTTLMPERLKNKYLNELERYKKIGKHHLMGRTVTTIGLKKDGTEFPFEMSLSSWKSGERIYFTSIIRDLTERKQLEKEREILLKESQRVQDELSILIENIVDEVWFCNKQGEIVLANAAARKFEQDAKPDDEKSLDGLIQSLEIYNSDGEPRPREGSPLLRSLKGEVITDLEEIVVFPGSDKKHHRQVSSAPIKTKDGEIRGAVAVVHDITEKKKVNESLKESEEKYRTIIETAREGIWSIDENANTTYVNQAMADILGYSADEMMGKSLFDFMDDEGKIDATDKMERRREGIKEVHDFRFIHKEGHNVWTLISTNPLFDKHGDFSGALGMLSDITHRKQMEAQIKDSLEEKEILLKEIHHRVKNNLAVISSLLELQSQYIKDKEDQELFRESQTRAKSMALIHELLYQSIDLKSIDFSEYMRTLINELFRTYLVDPGLVKLDMDLENVKLDINTSIPLGLIVNELVSNSMKHAFPDGREGTIKINFKLEDDHYLMSVYDNGVGFPEDLDFKNTDSLGLRLVNSLTDQIDGIIKLDRSQGTEFKITFKEII
jgi:PAS domain S-box-containing protein